jgi:hypothetical protein
MKAHTILRASLTVAMKGFRAAPCIEMVLQGSSLQVNGLLRVHEVRSFEL